MLAANDNQSDKITHTSECAAHNLNIETSRVRVGPLVIVIGSRVESGRVHTHTYIPSPSPYHHVSTILNILWQLECVVVGLLVHVTVGN